MFRRLLYTLTAASLFIPGSVISQSESSYPDCTYVKPDTSMRRQAPAHLFRAINISDCRFDTSKLGSIYGMSNHERLIVCMQGGLISRLTSLLNGRLASGPPASDDRVLACLRKFWITSYGRESIQYDLSFRIEYYLNRGSCFYPLYRFDTSYVLDGSPEGWAAPINAGVLASARKLYRADRNIDQLKCYSNKQVDSFNYAGRDLPILKDKLIRRGVYLSFGQFKRNMPEY